MRTDILNADGTTTFIALEDGNLITGTSQDYTAILEDAKARHKEGFHGSSELKHAGRVPLFLIEKYLNDNRLLMSEFTKNPDHMKRLLNDPAIEYYRIWKGRI